MSFCIESRIFSDSVEETLRQSFDTVAVSVCLSGVRSAAIHDASFCGIDSYRMVVVDVVVAAAEGNHWVFGSLSCSLPFRSISDCFGCRNSDRIFVVCDLWNVFSVYDDPW